MILTPALRKFTLTTHITFSVGWLGAVAVFLLLTIIGITSQDIQLAKATYLAMEVSALFVIVPFCLASLITGIIQAIGTEWGLLRHYWIVVKLILTIAATVLLLLHLKPISQLARIATDAPVSNAFLPELRMQVIADAGGGLLLLLVITTISVYKPWGRIQCRLREDSMQQTGRNNPKRTFGFYAIAALLALIVLFIVIHLFGGGMGNH